MKIRFANEVHQRLETLYPNNKIKQYKWLRKHTRKAHVSDLDYKEYQKVLKYLRKNKMPPEFIWEQVESELK